VLFLVSFCIIYLESLFAHWLICDYVKLESAGTWNELRCASTL